MTDVMIRTKSLSKSFGGVRALDKVTFEVKRGEVVGFLGPNGAGKSTTMRILTCFIAPSAGEASVHGFDVFDSPLEVRQKIGYLPQRAPLYTDMNVWEYLRFVSDLRGLDESTFKARLKKVVEVCGLNQVLGKDIGTLSHGYRQRVGLGQALIHDPPILILDEPTADLDPNEKAEVIRYIKEIGRDRTVLLSTHNLAEVEQACARAIIVSKGRIVADGDLDVLRSRTGGVRYIVTIDAKDDKGTAISATQAQEAFQSLPGSREITERPGAADNHKFEFSGPQEGDMRGDISRMVVGRGWTLLELKREAQSLESIFADLTQGDEHLDRGANWAGNASSSKKGGKSSPKKTDAPGDGNDDSKKETVKEEV